MLSKNVSNLTEIRKVNPLLLLPALPFQIVFAETLAHSQNQPFVMSLRGLIPLHGSGVYSPRGACLRALFLSPSKQGTTNHQGLAGS